MARAHRCSTRSAIRVKEDLIQSHPLDPYSPSFTSIARARVESIPRGGVEARGVFKHRMSSTHVLSTHMFIHGNALISMAVRNQKTPTVPIDRTQTSRCICRCRYSGLVGGNWIHEITLWCAAQNISKPQISKGHAQLSVYEPTNDGASPESRRLLVWGLFLCDCSTI